MRSAWVSSRRSAVTLIGSRDALRRTCDPTQATYSSVDDKFLQRTPRRVECAPQPKPSHSPSCQYLRLCRQACPGRATLEISYCRNPARSSRSRLHKYISAASSSGACDQPRRAISSLSGAFGYSSSR